MSTHSCGHCDFGVAREDGSCAGGCDSESTVGADYTWVCGCVSTIIAAPSEINLRSIILALWVTCTLLAWSALPKRAGSK